MREVEYSQRCHATIYKRDTYRRTGRTKSGFEMHYTRDRCHRRAVEGGRRCWQHAGRPGMDYEYCYGECCRETQPASQGVVTAAGGGTKE